MNCRDIQPLLAGYVEGEVDRYEQILIEQHLGECPFCSAEVSQLRVAQQRVQRKIKNWAALAMPPASARERLMSTIAAEKQSATQSDIPTAQIDRRLTMSYKQILFASLIAMGIAISLYFIFSQTH